MNKYEVLYIISQDVADDAREAMINNFADIVVKNGGTVDNIDKIGLKKFAYEIDGKREYRELIHPIGCSHTFCRYDHLSIQEPQTYCLCYGNKY